VAGSHATGEVGISNRCAINIYRLTNPEAVVLKSFVPKIPGAQEGNPLGTLFLSVVSPLRWVPFYSACILPPRFARAVFPKSCGTRGIILGLTGTNFVLRWQGLI
jgi:hypothetical protein